MLPLPMTRYLLAATGLACLLTCRAAEPPATVIINGAPMPYSAYASDAARHKFMSMIGAPSAPPAGSAFPVQKKFYADFNHRYAEAMRRRYAVEVQPARIAGVATDVVTPAGGVSAANRKRVLINLHGGAFLWGEHDGGLIESVPIASLGRIKVVTVDYRQGPDHVFPAASEDVVAVYGELLKTYQAKNIGIYGCSAGGILSAQSVAWMTTHDLPVPGAVGTFCGSLLDPKGDSAYLAAPLAGQPFTDHPPSAGDLPYFKGVDLSDPMVQPGLSAAVVAKFPPTLLITGSRDFAMSSVLRSNELLVEARVETELHVYDGMWHAFFIDPELPESQAVYQVVVRFFDRHLGA